MSKAREYYNKNIEGVNENIKALNKIISVFSIVRLVIVLSTALVMFYFYKSDKIIALFSSMVIGIIIYIVIAIYHNGKINEKNKQLLLLEYNETGLKRLDGSWREFEDYGKEFIDIKHSFSSDLDIFGKNSLFQWINVTKSKFGREALANILKMKYVPNKKNIEKRQEAIRELADKRQFCKDIYLQSYSKKDKNKNDYSTIDKLLQWMESDSNIDLTPKYVPYLFIAVTAAILLLTVLGKLSPSILILDLMINYLVIRLLTKNLEEIINIVVINKRKIIQYANVLSIIEAEEFQSEDLQKMKKYLKSPDGDCEIEMKKLQNIINWLGDSKGNAYYLILNLFMMSDIFILHNLQVWRKSNGNNLRRWFEVMGEFEAVISLSNLAFEHEEWNYPEISDMYEIEGIEIGHPLLGERAKVNNFALKDKKKTALITGSNMSGKSTFLRTIGFNMIFSYLGLPTCAKQFKCGVFNICTCMRTQDNLEESISSFYAEILRIKLVIEAAKEGKRVFFLLDEIFKGTNSKDRHHGAQILIKQLVEYGGMGLVSTHDMELCDLENNYPWIINFNFQEYYSNNKIMFDYKLRKGRSTTQNAKYLMKMAGIDID